MANKHLATYLSDHLAGSTVALELLTHLEKAHADTATAGLLTELHADIEADRQELEALMERLHVAESSPRKVMGWLTERITQLKLRLDDPSDGAFRLLESLEVLALGIEGKQGLWKALAAVAMHMPELQGMDYERLTQRAEDQRGRVEGMRLEAAKEAFVAAS
jgi:hypothetical protein